jgi:hypothetical protein
MNINRLLRIGMQMHGLSYETPDRLLRIVKSKRGGIRHIPAQRSCAFWWLQHPNQ